MSISLFDLKVESDEPLSVVEIVDGRYRLIKQATRSVCAAVPPGLYITRVKYPDRVDEKLVEHKAEATYVHFGADHAEATLARRAEDAAHLSQHMKSVRSIGFDTWVTVSIKAPGLGKLPTSQHIQLPDWSQFAVHTLDGRPLVHQFDDSATAEGPPSEHDRIVSRGLPVGWYSLRIPTRDGAWAHLPLYVSGRSSPTVLLEVGGVNDGRLWFDFNRLVVSYDQREGDAYDDPLRVSALRAARRSLELGRNGLNDELMRVFFDEKLRDPMLGLFALQLLLLRAKTGLKADSPTLDQFTRVMNNVAVAFDLPQHPDLVLSRAQARRLKWPIEKMVGDDEPLVAPPLLRANWNGLVGMPSRRRELVDNHRLLRRVGEGLLQSGIWVMWKPPAGSTEQMLQGQFENEARAEEGVVVPERLKLGRSPHRRIDEEADAQFSESYRDYNEVRVSRPSRSIDALLEQIVDQVRADAVLHRALQGRLVADPSTSSVLERAVSRSVLQLAEAESQTDQNVPTGFARRMAKDLAVPFTLVGDTVKRMSKEVRHWSPITQQRGFGQRSFLP